MAMEMMALRTTGGSKVDDDYAAEEGNNYYVKREWGSLEIPASWV